MPRLCLTPSKIYIEKMSWTLVKLKMSKNTIRDGGSTALYAVYTVYTVYTFDTFYMVYTVDLVYTVGTVYTVIWLKLLIWVVWLARQRGLTGLVWLK